MKDLVPEKWLIGIRSATAYSNSKLAYLTFIEENGSINSEKSWDAWRNVNLKPIEFENTLIEGWQIKDDYHQRHGESTRKVAIIIEPRTGYEFELDLRELVRLIQNVSIVDGVLQGKYCLTRDRSLISEKNLLAAKSQYDDTVTGKTVRIGDKFIRPGKRNSDDTFVYMGKFWSYSLQYDCEDVNYRQIVKSHYIEEIEPRFVFASKYGATANKTFPKNLIKIDNISSESEEFQSLSVTMNKLYNRFYKKSRSLKPELILKENPRGDYLLIDNQLYWMKTSWSHTYIPATLSGDRKKMIFDEGHPRIIEKKDLTKFEMELKL